MPSLEHVAMKPRVEVNKGTVHSNIYQIPNLPAMINAHLRVQKQPLSEFSSWGSLSVAITFLFKCKREHRAEARIAIIDTRKFPGRGIYHVRDFHAAGWANSTYSWEYLIHGSIQGGPHSGYSSALWSDLVQAGIPSLISPQGLELEHLPSLLPRNRTIPPLTTNEVETAIKVAIVFGRDSVVPVVAAVLSHVHRSWQRVDSPQARTETKMIGRAVFNYQDTGVTGYKNMEVDDYTRTPAIMTDIVYTTRYVEIHQMINLLRLLSMECHGNPAQSAQEEVRDGIWDPSNSLA